MALSNCWMQSVSPFAVPHHEFGVDIEIVPPAFRTVSSSNRRNSAPSVVGKLPNPQPDDTDRLPSDKEKPLSRYPRLQAAIRMSKTSPYSVGIDNGKQ